MYWPKGSYLFNRPSVQHLYNRAKRCKVISSIEDIIAVELVGEANNKSNNYHLAKEIERHTELWRAKPGFSLTPIN